MKMARRKAAPELPPVPEWDPFPHEPGWRPPAAPAAPPARRRRLWPALLLAGCFAAGALGAYLAVRSDPAPDACLGAAFVSEAFGYCVDPPAGWVASQGADEPTGVDAFRIASAPTVVFVEAVELSEGQELDAFVAELRARSEAQGYAPGPQSFGTLAGEPTVQWEIRVSSPEGDTVVREIAVVRDDIGWRLQVADSADRWPTSAREIEALLDSWRFA
jgi:hypothetical protein